MQRNGIAEILRIDISDDKKENMHSHQDVELLYVMEGNVYLTIDGRMVTVAEGDIYIINSNKMHGLYLEKAVVYVKISIFYQYIAGVLNRGNSSFLCYSDTDNGGLKRTIKKLLECYVKKEENKIDFGYQAICYELIDILQKKYIIQQTNIPTVKEEKFQQRIAMINEYISNNYQFPISMKELSDNLYLSNGYLSRFFKENYGMSFLEYLTKIRLHHAMEDLIYTDIPITQVAYDNGFPSAVAFNRVFKKECEQTPSEYRKKYGKTKKNEKEEERRQASKQKLKAMLTQKKEMKVASAGDVESETEECGIYQEGKYTDICYIWNQTINIGAAEELLKVDICEHIVLLKGALKFKYVRFWNLFSEELLLDSPDESEEYNFTNVDCIIDFLLKEELIPHIELTRKPKRIQKNAEISIIYREDDDMMQQSEKWNQCMEALMKHWVVRYGAAEIGKWRMEMSYDIEQHNYLDYFSVLNETYNIIRKYSGKMEIGAGGFKAGMINQIDKRFWDEWGKQKWKPDFISMMHYAYKARIEDGHYYFEQNADVDIEKDIEQVKLYLGVIGQEDKKIYVTEWGTSVSDRNFINDSCFVGAYIVKTILSAYGTVKELGYGLGSDRTSQYYDSKTLLFGGRGLITKDGILKPSGFAIEFLNRLYPYEMGHKKNHMLTTDGHNNYALICHNQKELNYHYYFTDESMVQKEALEKYYDDAAELGIKVFIANVPNGKYKIKIYSVNENSGSILNNWKKLNYDKDISRSDIQYLRRVNEPLLSIKILEANNNTLKINYMMAANEIAYLHISLIK